MTLFSYEIFDAVARQGSFNKAAQQLHLTPSAFCHAIAVMEAVLGFTLFNRGKNGVTMTSYVASLYPSIRAVLNSDEALQQSIARLNGLPVTVIGLERCHDTKEKLFRNFGSAHPEGYRKALRQMKLAEKFHRPVVCFVDTAGAFCGIAAEERGQAQAIAENLYEMMTLKTPILSIFIGEGGSGGALGLAVADEVWMLENAVYSVISPEGCASILWKDSSKVREAAACLRMTAQDLLEFGIIEKVIPEEQNQFEEVYQSLKAELYEKLSHNATLPIQQLLDNRYNRIRRLGAGNG